jgi:hypothetical protein
MKGGLIGAHIEHLGDGGQEILVAQVGMTTFEGVEILLADGRKAPALPGATVELARAVHRERCGGVIEHQPLHPLHVRLVLEKVRWMAREHRLHVGFVAF